MPTEITVFISSKMVELKTERKRIQEFLPTLNNDRYILKAWTYETDAPATSKSIREVYLDALKESDLYIGLFWHEYGEWTIDEFEKAGEWGIPRHIYVKDVATATRDSRLETFLTESQSITSGESHKWFESVADLETAIEQGIAAWAEEALFHHPGSLNALIAKDADDIPNHVAPRKFIGRVDTQQEIMTELSAQEHVLLQGFGGMGKTALAGTLAIDWLENGQGNVIWLTAGSETADTLFEAIACPLDAVKDLYAITQNERPQFVKQLLKRTQATLLVIDDVWNGKHLQTLLNAVPRSIAVLVTSRLRLPIDVIVEIEEMPPFEAIDLLGHYARQSYQGNANAEALCELLGYHAYALEIAGSTIKSTKQNPEDLYTQIEASPDTLRMPYNFAMQGRENVGKLIDISLKGLDLISRETFMAFGAMFVPSATAELLSLYNEREEGIIEQSLNELVGRGLVNVVEATATVAQFYRVHALVHSYTHIYVVDTHSKRALDSCLVYTEKYNEPNHENFVALEAELGNLIEVANYAVAINQWQIVSDLGFNLYCNSQILEYRGYYERAIGLLKKGVQAANQLGNLYDEGSQLGNLGVIYNHLGKFGKALEYHERALTISREISDQYLESSQISNLGIVYGNLGEFEKALDYHQQALAIALITSNQRQQGSSFINLGNAYYNLQNYEFSISFYLKALTNSRELCERHTECICLGNLGLAYQDTGRYVQGIDHHMQALAIAREIGNHASESSQLAHLGSAYADLHQYNESIYYHEQALAISVETGDRVAEGNSLGNIGSVYGNLQQYKKSIAYFQEARNIFIDLNLSYRVEWANNFIRLAEIKGNISAN